MKPPKSLQINIPQHCQHTFLAFALLLFLNINFVTSNAQNNISKEFTAGDYYREYHQDTTTGVIVTVRSAYDINIPVGNAIITLTKDDTVIRTDSTNQYGGYMIKSLEQGDYTLEVRKEGFCNKTITDIPVKRHWMTRLTINLSKQSTTSDCETITRFDTGYKTLLQVVGHEYGEINDK